MSPAAVPPLELRVTVSDGWRTVAVKAAAQATARDVKVRALQGAGIEPKLEGRYDLKFGGGALADDARLDAAGVPDGAGLVVCPRRRRPVR